MKGTVESVRNSSSGKSWRVKIAGKEYGANFDTKLDQAVGKGIDFEWDDGKFGLWIKSWDFDRSGAVPAPQAPVAPPSQSSGHSNGDRFYLPFVSNTCAHAIAAGVIKTPQDLNQWARAAHDVAVALDAL